MSNKLFAYIQISLIKGDFERKQIIDSLQIICNY